MEEESQRRRDLLDAATRVFGQYGYHQAGIRGIAEAAHCAVGTFYLYFSSKPDCFLALIDELYGRVIEAVLESRTGLDSPVEKLRASLAAVVRILLQERELSRVVLVHGAGSEPLLDSHLWNIHETFANLIATELQECGLDPEEAAIGAWAWVGALSEVFQRWARTPDVVPLENAALGVQRLFWASWHLDGD